MKDLFKSSVLVLSLTTGLFFAGCGNKGNESADNMDQHQDHDDLVYACPMHPEVTGKKGDTCPKCGMDLVPVDGEDGKTTQVKLTTSPEQVTAGGPVKLSFTFRQNDRDLPLEIAHEKKVHLIVVKDDLSWFHHIHPEESGDGNYDVTETFPSGGNYLLFADFKPSGGSQTIDRKEIRVNGDPGSPMTGTREKLISVVDGFTVRLVNGIDFQTNRDQAVEISIESGGKKLLERDLEPYLGASAHIVMISRESKDYLHLHPSTDSRFPIYAKTNIEKPGIYHIWVQFQVNGKVHTANFVVDVEQNESNTGSHEHH